MGPRRSHMSRVLISHRSEMFERSKDRECNQMSSVAILRCTLLHKIGNDQQTHAHTERFLCFDNFLTFFDLFFFSFVGAFANFPLQCCAQSANSTSRGCLTTNREAIACANDQEHCTWCNVDETGACNRAAFPVGRRQCLHCDSTVDKNCPTNTTSTDTKSIYCDNVADLCIIINKGPKSTQSLLQTCSEKISNSDVEFCRANKSSCIACTENNCNWPKPCDPSSSNQINVMHSATVVAIVAFGFLMS